MTDPSQLSPAAEPTEDDERAARARRIMEAMIFASGRPVGTATLAAQVPEGTDVEGELATLRAHYTHRGFQLVKVAGGWTFRTASDLADHLAVHRVVRRRLSRAALETLAIVAYHQPVTRAEVEDIRGVHLGRGTLDILLEAGWIAPKGRRRTPGRPVTWCTTPQFMEHFGLESLDDLPGVEELEAAGLLDSADPQVEGAGEAPAQLPQEDPDTTPDATDEADDESLEGSSPTVVPLSGRGAPTQ